MHLGGFCISSTFGFSALPPGTLPNGVEPIAYADFKNGVYTLNGSACAITDIFEQDTNFGVYSPSDVVAGVGLVASYPILKPAIAAAPLTNGYTVVLQGVWSQMTTIFLYGVDLPNWAQELYAGLGYDNLEDNFNPYIQGVHGNQVDDDTNLAAGRHKLGASIDGTDVALSVDGDGTISVTGGPASTLDTIAIYAQNDVDAPVETWGIYPYQGPSSLNGLTG